MNKQDVNYVGGVYKVVECTFELDCPTLSEYTYKIDADVEVEEGDLMVVESSNGLGIVRCLNVLENCLANADAVKQAKAWVVQVIDYSTQKARKEATVRREYVIQQLEERKKAVESLNIYALLAETDPEAKKLLAELKTIDA